jgi:hypothetical protein
VPSKSISLGENVKDSTTGISVATASDKFDKTVSDKEVAISIDFNFIFLLNTKLSYYN